MGIRNGLEVLLCLAAVSIVCSQSESPATDSPRNYLFVKPRDFAKQRATNKTRFTVEEKLLLIQIHNSYRSLVLPSATNMRELIWDDDLEEYAYNHTQACTGAHSAGTMLKKFVPELPESWKTWRYMGENLYYSFAPWYNIEEAMWMFWREGADYDIRTHSCTPGKECGHYRVTTLAHSTRVGCAMNTCKNFTVSKYPTPAVFFACSYDGEYLIYYKPYTVGDRGSDCTYAKQSYDFQYYRNGLCISPESFFFYAGFDGNTSVVGLPSPYLNSTSTTATPSTTASTFTSTITSSTTTIITTSAAPQPNTTESQEPSETTVTTLVTETSTVTTPVTETSTVTTPVTESSTVTTLVTESSTVTTLVTESSTVTTSEITDSTVVVTTHQPDTTSVFFMSTTAATTSYESPTAANSSTVETTSVGHTTNNSTTVAIYTTDSLTTTTTKHTRTVNLSSRPSVWLSRSASILLLFIPAIFN